jgi:hypothetical protein
MAWPGRQMQTEESVTERGRWQRARDQAPGTGLSVSVPLPILLGGWGGVHSLKWHLTFLM